MSTKNLLVELFVEELPPKALRKLGEAFANTLADSLRTQGLASNDAKVTAYATPRRLAVHVTEVATVAPDKAVSQKLMPVSVGLDASGQATPALLKRLVSLGADESAVPKLKREMDGKAEALFFDNVIKGATLADGLQLALNETLAKLPIPKVMTYQLADGWSSVNFVRPAHGLIALHGAEIVPVTALGLTAGNTTQGHRFEAKVSPITIKSADSYEQQLQTEGAVIASFEKRRKDIIKRLLKIAQENNSRIDCQPDLFSYNEETTILVVEDDALINEVTALVERPNVLLGQFEGEFLEVPAECLSLTMKSNQKYFPLYENVSGRKGRLTNKFLIVSNINPADPSAVIGGNERVVRPRLADAKFFFDQDRKKTLESRVPGLAKIVYHNKLGTQSDRMERVMGIAVNIADKLGDQPLMKKVKVASVLAKTDLLTDMVGEFPELQGIMGGYYARHDGLTDEIAFAIEDHYKPRFAGDELPRNLVGLVVALADKLETLVGMFGIGNLPSGDRDPFALRRHALGVIRILTEQNLNLSLASLLQDSEDCWLISAQNQSINALSVSGMDALRDFIYDRLAGSLREQGYTPQEIDAVLTLRPQLLGDIPKRLEAVRSFSYLPEAESLAAANKRVGNILKKAEGTVQANADNDLLIEPAEIALNQALTNVKPQADSAFERGDYTTSLKALAALKAPVDDFFDNVMVNAEAPALRSNRLALLSQLHAAMNRVADLSKLAA